MTLESLRDEGIPTDGGDLPQQDFQTSDTSPIQVYFQSWKKELLKHIAEADVIFGAVAWLTDFDILDALAKKKVLIVVQKEDFLRPDSGPHDRDWRVILQEKYAALKPYGWHHCMDGCATNLFKNYADLVDEFSGVSYMGGPDETDAVRCVGNYNSDKHPAFPRMHNKTLIFARLERTEFTDHGTTMGTDVIKPYAVFTGSANLTHNATKSFENAVFIESDKIAQAYLYEWQQIFLLSEALDWRYPWIEPEYRIGS